MYCQQCGKQNEPNANFCRSCGAPIEEKKVGTSSVWKWVVGFGLIFILLLGGGILALSQGVVGKFLNAFEKDDLPTKEIVLKEDEQKELIQTTGKVEKEQTEIIAESMPKVFTIFTEDSLGSGFLYKKGGYIVTNAHVVAGYRNVIIRNSDGEDTKGKVIGISDHSDIALIQSESYANVEPLVVEKEETSIGASVIAIGSPHGFENTASIGYLTGIDRNIDYGFVYENIYQIDAQIDQGSSGGPLLDGKTGKVIGINSLLFNGNTSFGFAIPMHSMVRLLDNWISHPMSEQDIASLFGLYDNYAYYDEDIRNEANAYYEEYVEEYSDSYEEDWFGYDYDYEDEYDDYDEEDLEYEFDEMTLKEFVLYFRSEYEYALYNEDFSWIESLLLPGSEAYLELEEYVGDVKGEGMAFDFIDNIVTDIQYVGDEAVVSTFETFDFTDKNGKEMHYEREKDYVIVLDEDGHYQISQIKIH